MIKSTKKKETMTQINEKMDNAIINDDFYQIEKIHLSPFCNITLFLLIGLIVIVSFFLVDLIILFFFIVLRLNCGN